MLDTNSGTSDRKRGRELIGHEGLLIHPTRDRLMQVWYDPQLNYVRED